MPTESVGCKAKSKSWDICVLVYMAPSNQYGLVLSINWSAAQLNNTASILWPATREARTQPLPLRNLGTSQQTTNPWLLMQTPPGSLGVGPGFQFCSPHISTPSSINPFLLACPYSSKSQKAVQNDFVVDLLTQTFSKCFLIKNKYILKIVLKWTEHGLHGSFLNQIQKSNSTV